MRRDDDNKKIWQLKFLRDFWHGQNNDNIEEAEEEEEEDGGKFGVEWTAAAPPWGTTLTRIQIQDTRKLHEDSIADARWIILFKCFVGRGHALFNSYNALHLIKIGF